MELGEIAFDGRVREEVIFKWLPDGCDSLGLFISYSELYRKKNITYRCMHLTLQEFLGAFFISKQTPEEQRKLFMEHHEKKHLNVVWRFVSGLTKMQEIGWEMFGREMEKLKCGYEVEEDEVRIHPFFVQCVYESQDKDNFRSILHQVNVAYNGFLSSSLFDVYALGYCIASCTSHNVWSVDLNNCNLGPELVDMLVQGLKSVECDAAFIEKLNLSHNHIADKGAKCLEKLPHQILTQIKTLDLSYCGIGGIGLDILADLIPCMPSLISLAIKNNPVGEGGLVKLLQELGKHETIQRLNVQKISALGVSDITALKLSHVVKPSSLRELYIGELSPQLVKSLVRTVFSSSSLKVLNLLLPLFPSPLKYIDTISNSLTNLTLYASHTSSKSTTDLSSSSLSTTLSHSKSFFFHPTSPSAHLSPQDASSEHSSAKSIVKGGTKFSYLLKRNKTLEYLVLNIPLDEDEFKDICDCLSHNKSLIELELSEKLHSQYIHKSKELDSRIKWSV